MTIHSEQVRSEEPEYSGPDFLIVAPNEAAGLMLCQARELGDNDPSGAHALCAELLEQYPEEGEAGLALLLQAQLSEERGSGGRAAVTASLGKALELSNRLADREPFVTAAILGTYSDFLGKSDNIAGAITYAVRALQLVERNLTSPNYSPEQHVHLFGGARSLLLDSEDLSYLEGVANDTLESLQQTFGPNLKGHPAESVAAVAHGSLAFTAYAMGDCEGCRTALGNQLSSLKNDPGLTDPDLIGSVELQLAALNFVTFRPSESADCLKAALRFMSPLDLVESAAYVVGQYRMNPGDELLVVSGVFDQLSKDAVLCGAFGAPLANLPHLEQELGNALVYSWAQVASAHTARGDLSNATEKRFELVNYLERVAPNSEMLAKAYTRLGEVCFGSGRYADAQLAYQRAIEIAENHLGTPNEMLRDLYYDVGAVHYKLGRKPEAKAAMERALAIAHDFGDAFGEQLATIYNGLACVCYDIRELDSAVRYSRTAIEMTETGSPFPAPKMVEFLLDHAQHCYSLGKATSDLVAYEEAWRHLERVDDLLEQFDEAETFDLKYRGESIALQMAISIPRYRPAAPEAFRVVESLLRNRADIESEISTAEKFIFLGSAAIDYGDFNLARRSMRSAQSLLGNHPIEEVMQPLIKLVTASAVGVQKQAASEIGMDLGEERERLPSGFTAAVIGEDDELDDELHRRLAGTAKEGRETERKLRVSELTNMAANIIAVAEHMPGRPQGALQRMLTAIEAAGQVSNHSSTSTQVARLRDRIAETA